ncbi:hypothetical protein [Pseudarthrobacter sp. N5]
MKRPLTILSAAAAVAGDIPVGVAGRPSQAIQGDSSTYSVVAPL